MKLYSGPMSMFGAKAQIAALEKGAATRKEVRDAIALTDFEGIGGRIRFDGSVRNLILGLGEKNVVVLDFDHVDSATKRSDVGSMLSRRRWVR